MARNPYRWQQDQPQHLIERRKFVERIHEILARGAAVKLVGGRGMGKSVALRQVKARLEEAPGTRPILISSPPVVSTLSELVMDLAARLGAGTLTRPSLDELMEQPGIDRVVVLLDEIDQYLSAGGQELTVRWLNLLESTRKSWPDRFGVLIAGGLGTLHLGHVLGSGLTSRAETVVARPFDLDELRELAEPMRQQGSPLTDTELQVIHALSGGNPALATYALEQLWTASPPHQARIERLFVEFAAHHRDFLESVRDGVSRRGFVGAPGRVLEVIRGGSGVHRQQDLRAACEGDDPPVDVVQALQILEAAGLVRVDESPLAHEVQVHAVTSILNMTQAPAAGASPAARLTGDVAQALGQLHRFGRDFHSKSDLLPEEVFSSILAVTLGLLGWSEIAREPTQAAGFADLRVPLGDSTHVVVEAKIWPRNDIQEIQQQVDDYWVSDTAQAIVVVLGKRSAVGWAANYEAACLGELTFTRLETPPDLVGHWQVQTTDAEGRERVTHHFVVQLPKRT